MKFEQNKKTKKVLVVRGDYSCLQRILKQAFEIDGEIIQKYEADWGILWIWMILSMIITVQYT